MELKESDIILLEMAHKSIDGCSFIMNKKVWEAFKLGIKYNQLKEIEDANKD